MEELINYSICLQEDVDDVPSFFRAKQILDPCIKSKNAPTTEEKKKTSNSVISLDCPIADKVLKSMANCKKFIDSVLSHFSFSFNIGHAVL